MSNGLAVRPTTEIQPREDWEVIQEMAKKVAASGLFKMSEPQVLTLMLLAESEGLHPIKALMRYHVIEGKPSMRADCMQAEFQNAGGRVTWVHSDAESCEAEFSHPSYGPAPFVVRLTFKEFVDSGVATFWDKNGKQQVSPNWRKFGAQMLRARAITAGVRAVLPGVIMGLYSEEEHEAIDSPAPEAVAQHKALVERLAGRRENPRDNHQPVAEVVAEMRAATQPTAPLEPATEWGKAINAAVLDFNQGLAKLSDEQPANLKLRTAIKPQQVVNAVLNDYIERGIVTEDVLKNEKGKRDPGKAADTLTFLWQEDSEDVEAAVGKYLTAKMAELMGQPVQGELLPA